MNNLRAIRNKLKLTQAELAKLIGCTQGNIGFYERLDQRIRQEVAEKIISVAKERGLDITYEHLYGAKNVEPIQIAREEKPSVEVLYDIFGGSNIVLNGRVFITINYIAPYIDNAGMRTLTNRILQIVQAKSDQAESLRSKA